ncbi:uncharacterized protein LOC126836980 [Adelges cooleyi]|uniref:uncharacterized protein LOC126836980 n=1 Tax=Adelges cooleyi TaxID=133065 RepID=UPI00218079BC|nr:uncharacterized protein LOC126836980 [Adelges cooleyi]
MVDDKGLPDLLIYLGTLEKLSDEWKEITFTTFDLNLFMKIFKQKDKEGVEGEGEADGLLTHDKLVSLIHDNLILEPKFVENIMNEFKDADSINALMFLATILKHKPEGKGLDIIQLRKCSALYKSFSVHLSTDSLVDLFLSLQIVSEDYVGLLYEIEHVRKFTFILL